MAKHLSIDEKPGPAPEIHASGDSVVFAFPLDEVGRGTRLVLRFDKQGGGWVSIAYVGASGGA